MSVHVKFYFICLNRVLKCYLFNIIKSDIDFFLKKKYTSHAFIGPHIFALKYQITLSTAHIKTTTNFFPKIDYSGVSS